MEEKIYSEYALLDAQIKTLTNQKDELKVKILEDLIAKDAKNLDTPYGKFAISNLKTWTYTSRVSELEEEFKAQKAHEQSVGTATFTEKPSLRFVQSKF